MVGAMQLDNGCGPDTDERRHTVPAVYAEGYVDGLLRPVEHVFHGGFAGELRRGEG